MDIDKKEFLSVYLNACKCGNYNKFFKKAKEITEFILVRKYYPLTIDPDEYADVLQDCMVSLWEKILANKIDTSKGDLMSFVWKNSNYKILDYLKKKNRRKNIVQILTYSEVITEASYVKKYCDYGNDEQYEEDSVNSYLY